MWCDDFDMDLPKVVPDAMPILARVPDSVILRTHGHEYEGKLNHPTCWNTYGGLAAYFTLTPGPVGPVEGWRGHGIAPEPCVTNNPIDACTFTEAIRECWCHDFMFVCDGTVIWDAQPAFRKLFEPLMYHVRGWRRLDEDRAARLRRQVCVQLTLATERMLALAGLKPLARV